MLLDLMSYKLAKVSGGLSFPTARMYFAEFGLKMLDWRIIVALAHEAPVTLAELATLIEADKGNVSRSVASLEASKLVRRAPSADDQRRTVLELTPRGEALFARINPIARARETHLLGALDEGERDELARILDKLIAQLAAMDSGEDDAGAPASPGDGSAPQ